MVSEHAVSWDANGNRTIDVSSMMDADDPGNLLDRTHTYTYDPRDRIAEVVKTDTSSGSTLATESYVHDAASNVIEQTIDGTATTFTYDRNRLLTATTGGVTGSYNYDPFGRLDTVVSAGEVVESYSYDGFDRIAEHTSLDESGATETTSYSYDAMDRTTSRTDAAGETTDYTYLGLSGEVLNEEIAGQVQKSYQHSPWGKRLSQVTHNSDGSTEDGYYGYNLHTDVETVTDDTGNTTSTYGYTAYGNDDTAEFTGIDAPDAGTPGQEPYNVYRYNAKRWDAATGNYDMGFRDYDPGINRFLSRDMYTGALADLNLGLSPWTNNRYAFTGGNPTTFIERDGHRLCAVDCGAGVGGSPYSAIQDEYFGDPAPGDVRETFKTASSQAGNGIILARFYIQDSRAVFRQVLGDDRGPTTDAQAPYRIAIAWNADTGEGTYTVTATCGSGALLGSSCKAQQPIRDVGPNSLQILEDINGEGLYAEYRGLNSKFDLCCEVSGKIGIAFNEAGAWVARVGDDYPSLEVYQYTREGSVTELAQATEGFPTLLGQDIPVGGLVAHPVFPNRTTVWQDGEVVLDSNACGNLWPSC